MSVEEWLNEERTAFKKLIELSETSENINSLISINDTLPPIGENVIVYDGENFDVDCRINDDRYDGDN